MTAPRHEGHGPIGMVIAVGDELLFGHTVDTNGSWLGERLSDLGFDVRRRWVVGDDPSEIRTAVEGAMDDADVVVVTGGLGPTPDDLTRPVVADLLGKQLKLSKDLLTGLQNRFRTQGIESVPEGAAGMAEVPEGARVLPNPIGAAPGLVLRSGAGTTFVLLPGVPREMKALFSEKVGPLLSNDFAARLNPVRHRIIPTFGVPESVLQDQLSSILTDELDGVTLAYLPDEVGVRLRLSARERPQGPTAAERLDALESAMDPVLARYRFDAESGDLAEAVGDAFRGAGFTLAVAESCTGGLIAKRITDIPGSSAFFLGGVVAYANEVKRGLLGLPAELMASGGVVSEAVAEALAREAANRLGATVGVGVTGIAGPEGGSQEKPVGTVCYCVSVPGEVRVRTQVFLGDRSAIRARATQAVLGLLLRMVRGKSR